MQREIKFRCFDVYKGYIYKIIQIDFEGLKIKLDNGQRKRLKNLGDGTLFIDGDYKIMQYTGLKDKNGVEIYEGDIVIKNHILYQVKYHIDHYYCGFVMYDISGKNISHGDYTNTEIIGNIYENAELLENPIIN